VYSLSRAMYFGAQDAQAAAAKLASLRAQAAGLRGKAEGNAAAALAEFEGKAEALQGNASAAPAGRGGGDAGGRGEAPAAQGAPASLTAVGVSLSRLMSSLQEADVRPTAIQLAAITKARQAEAEVMARWKALSGTGLTTLNVTLKAAGLPALAPQ
jgi:hypothetical protein